MEDKDIKILESVVNYRKIDGIYSTNEVIFKALEKLLQAYKQDEKVIEEMADYISDLDIDETICCKRTSDCYMDVFVENGCRKCIIDYFRKKCE